jgi:hypothetical protein
MATFTFVLRQVVSEHFDKLSDHLPNCSVTIAQFVLKPKMLTVATLEANYTVLVALRLKTFNTRLFVRVLLYKIQEIHFAEFLMLHMLQI